MPAASSRSANQFLTREAGWVRLAALLRDDVRCSMPPAPGLYIGRDAVVSDWIESGFEGMTCLRALLTCVNTCR